MSVKVMNIVWEHSKARGSQLFLLIAIADFADDEGKAYPGIPRLADKIRQEDRTVQRLLSKLKSLKELTISYKAGPNETNLYQVEIGRIIKNSRHKSGDKMSPGGDISRVVTSGVVGGDISGSYHKPSWNHHEKTNNARARAHEGVSEKSSPFPIPTLAEFTEKFFDAELTSWIEENAPAVMPQQVTARFIEHHQTENTQFKSAAAMLRAWRGYMRNAQAKAVERSAAKATRKEQGNGTTRKADARRAGGESRNIANLRATVEEFGIPESDIPRISGPELVRDAAAKAAAAKRAASERLIRDSIDRQRLAGGADGHPKRTSRRGV